MRLTKQTVHAIRILSECARAADGLTKIADLATRLDITKQNVFKIAHLLNKGGFLTGVRGPSGGVRLAIAPRDIRIGDVVRVIENPRMAPSDGRRRKAAKAGVIEGLFDDALTAFIDVLDQHTIAELSAPGRGAHSTEKQAGAEKAGGVEKAGKARASNVASPAKTRRARSAAH
ncbi:MAG: RrF2 family transcriptional regulator [Hyphomicrobium sp.]